MFSSPYTFSAKERDLETGYSYFGARYYDATLSVWLSVDPMTHERSWLSPYNYCLHNPIGRIDLDGNLCGDYYDIHGNWLGSDGKNDDIAYVADKVTKNEQGLITCATNAQKLSVTHTEFQTISAIVKHESGSAGSQEPLWIAHTANNNAKESGMSLYKKLMSGYSSVPANNKVPLSTSDNTSKANFARAAVINVLTGGADPTGGATFWDGTDFLAWGLNGPSGTSHAKFRQYNKISIQGNIYKTYLNNTLARYPSGKVRYYGEYYDIPASVFSYKSNWSNGDFKYHTGAKSSYGIEATGAVGLSIFWKKVK